MKTKFLSSIILLGLQTNIFAVTFDITSGRENELKSVNENGFIQSNVKEQKSNNNNIVNDISEYKLYFLELNTIKTKEYLDNISLSAKSQKEKEMLYQELFDYTFYENINIKYITFDKRNKFVSVLEQITDKTDTTDEVNGLNLLLVAALKKDKVFFTKFNDYAKKYFSGRPLNDEFVNKFISYMASSYSNYGVKGTDPNWQLSIFTNYLLTNNAYNEDLILKVIDLNLKRNNIEILNLIDKVIFNNPTNSTVHYYRALVFQKKFDDNVYAKTLNEKNKDYETYKNEIKLAIKYDKYNLDAYDNYIDLHIKRKLNIDATLKLITYVKNLYKTVKPSNPDTLTNIKQNEALGYYKLSMDNMNFEQGIRSYILYKELNKIDMMAKLKDFLYNLDPKKFQKANINGIFR